MDFLTEYKNALFLIAVLLAQAIALAVQVRSPVDASKPDGPSVRLIRMWAMTSVTPVERVTHAIGYGAGHAWSDYIDLRQVRQQNARPRRAHQKFRPSMLSQIWRALGRKSVLGIRRTRCCSKLCKTGPA